LRAGQLPGKKGSDAEPNSVLVIATVVFAGDVKKKLMPKGAIQSRTDFGTDGYGGPCPPQGDKPHHYHITVFAVDLDKLPDAKNDTASAALVGFDLNFQTLAKATSTGLYGR
jgi:Raf kinase inhibitor-like YbhB/YbcL family protein